MMQTRNRSPLMTMTGTGMGWLCACVAMTLSPIVPLATATDVAIDASAQGWFDQNGSDNGAFPSNNYVAGNCGINDCEVGEFRDWFQFDVPDLPATVASARLVIQTEDVILDQGPSMTYAVTSLPSTFGFGDLGTGSFYASANTRLRMPLPHR